MTLTEMIAAKKNKNAQNTTTTTNNTNAQSTYYCSVCGIRHNVKTGCDNPYNR